MYSLENFETMALTPFGVIEIKKQYPQSNPIKEGEGEISAQLFLRKSLATKESHGIFTDMIEVVSL